MGTVVDSVRRRVEVEPLTGVVALVDLALVGVFVVAGEISHNVAPLANPWLVADTYAPFLVGWLVVALAGGLYSGGARLAPRAAVVRTGLTWVGAALVAQVLRATPLFHGNADPLFFLVSVAVGLALLLPWRVTLAWLLRSES